MMPPKSIHSGRALRKVPLHRDFNFVLRRHSSIANMNVPSLTASERIENQLQQFRLDVFLPLLKPGVIVGIAFIVFRKRRLQAEANSEGFFFSKHASSVVRRVAPCSRLCL